MEAQAVEFLFETDQEFLVRISESVFLVEAGFHLAHFGLAEAIILA